MPNLAFEAIEAARENDWLKAAKLNLEILSQNEKDIEALNRLAHAYSELGKISQAKKTYHYVLAIDPYNSIAQKNLKKLNTLKEHQIPSSYANTTTSPCIFLEEPGKTRVVTLVNPAPASLLSTLSPGEPVELIFKKHQVSITREKTYLGALPDDLAHRLIHLYRVGNKYEANVLSVEGNNLQIFLQETKRGKRLGNHPSFPPCGVGDYFPSVRKGILEADKETPDLFSEEETEEVTEEEE